MLRTIQKLLNKEPWLKIEDRTQSPKFQDDLVELFDLCLKHAGEPFDALMLRARWAPGVFYFTPEAAKFFEHRSRQLAGPGVTVARCARPWFHKLTLAWLSGIEVYWH